MSQFIAYHVAEDGTEGPPFAVGTTEEECRESAMDHLLFLGWHSGLLQIQERPDIPEKLFADLKQFIDAYFEPAMGSA